ncbi:MAG: hypothetical protein WCX79_02135 [Candidatus Paceibacterota bacterium]|jgi:hypothetical protein
MKIESENLKGGDMDPVKREDINPIFTDESEKKLFIKILDLYSNSTINSPNLGEYASSQIPAYEVMKQINELGLIPQFRKLKKRFTFKALTSAGKEVELQNYERLARILLKTYKENKN